jgi:hypothetical protein
LGVADLLGEKTKLRVALIHLLAHVLIDRALDHAQPRIASCAAKQSRAGHHKQRPDRAARADQVRLDVHVNQGLLLLAEALHLRLLLGDLALLLHALHLVLCELLERELVHHARFIGATLHHRAKRGVLLRTHSA